MFTLFYPANKKLWVGGNNLPMVFPTAEAAKLYASNYPDCRLQLRKVVKDGDINWRARERDRIVRGDYDRPKFIDELEADVEHYLHLADKKPAMLAYTKDETKGARDLQSIISLQGYIETFQPKSTDEWRDRMRAAHAAAQTLEDGLKFASTPEEIVSVYTNYDDNCVSLNESCMRYPVKEYSEEGSAKLPHHPTYVYGAGDLAVAYTVNDRGRTTSRAMCWPAKKIYTRVYDDDDQLHRLLKKHGYTKSGGYYGRRCDGAALSDAPSFEGARLLRITWEHDIGVYLVPYCDDIHHAKDNGKDLIISARGNIQLNRTPVDGWSCETRVDEDENENENEDSGYYCDRCEDYFDEVRGVYVSRTRLESWCNSCSVGHTFYCDRSEEYYSEDDVSPVEVTAGGVPELWSEFAVADHGATCDRDDRLYPAEEMEEVIIDVDGWTENWGPRAISRHTWRCEKSDSLVSDNIEPAIVYVSGGYVEQHWAPHVAEEHARGRAVIVYNKPDDPGQLRLDLMTNYFNLLCAANIAA